MCFERFLKKTGYMMLTFVSILFTHFYQIKSEGKLLDGHLDMLFMYIRDRIAARDDDNDRAR